MTSTIGAPSIGGGPGPLAFMPDGKDPAIEDSSSGIDDRKRVLWGPG